MALGDVGVCLALALAGAALGAAAGLALAPFLSSHGLALAPGARPALPPAQCTQSLVATLSALLRGLGETTSNASAGDLHLTLVSGWSRSRPLCPCRTESETQDHLKAARLP